MGMKNHLLLLALTPLLVCGCARHYMMKLSNGMQVTTASKPHLKGGNYYFKDATGRVNKVPQSRVILIEPASMAKGEKEQFKPSVK